jgi:hypothetical protein
MTEKENKMSQQSESALDEAQEETAVAVSSNRAFTIPDTRLASSPACLNCGSSLMGPFCFYCGQPDKNLMRFFPALVREILEDVVDFDSRFMRTLKPLLFHPGKVTRDYLEGRRFRYVPPMRLYIFSSMAFFILAAMLAGQNISINSDEPGVGIHINGSSTQDALNEQLQNAVEEGKLSEEEAERVISRMEKNAELQEVLDDPDDPCSGEDVMCFGDEPWDRETNPLIIPGMPRFINDWINGEIGESPKKGREIEANPNLIVDKMFDVLPITVFIMLPLVALIFKFWYLFANKYYVEHLIHALHNHSFLFVIFILALLFDTLGGAFWLGSSKISQQILNGLSFALLCWIPIYLLISLKTVYRQNWFMTAFKFSLIGVSYLILLITITALAAVTSFVLL